MINLITGMSFGTFGTSLCHVSYLATILELLSHRRSTTLSIKTCPFILDLVGTDRGVANLLDTDQHYRQHRSPNYEQRAVFTKIVVILEKVLVLRICVVINRRILYPNI